MSISEKTEIPLEATAVHGIFTEHAQAHGADPRVAIAEILDVLHSLSSYPLVLVNAPFDLGITSREIRRYSIADDLQLAPNVIDTLSCDRAIDPYRIGRRTLTAAIAAYGLAIRGAHTAESDVLGAIRLARAMAAKHPKLAACDLTRLQDYQRQAHAQHAEHFENYRRSDGVESDFAACRDWPYRKPVA